ncbi:chromate transporter [Rhizobium mesoamericanum]|nr:chromate transporter [Rhizobium mesoamericanum]
MSQTRADDIERLGARGATTVNEAIAAADSVAAPTLRQVAGVWARIGCVSFGGPVGQIALMHRTIVDEKRWISEERFLHALNFCMLLPGPEAQQLAILIGWMMQGIRGGLIAGLLFMLPGFFAILALSSLYAVFQGAAWLSPFFFGVKAAVLAIVIEGLLRVGRRALKERFHYYVAGASFLAFFLLNLSFPLVIIVAGAAGLLRMRHRRHRLAAPAFPQTSSGRRFPTIATHAIAKPLVVLVFWILVWQLPLFSIRGIDAPADLIAETLSGETNVFGAIFVLFSKMAVVTFGGAYGVLSYVTQVAVGHYAWLQPGEMLDGLALAETTPGPLVLVLCFVGFLAGYRNPVAMAPLAGGVLGAFLAAWATFVPSFVWIFAGAPYIERLRNNENLSATVSAIAAAVTGVILNLSLWFAQHVLFAEVGRLALLSVKTGLPIVSVAWPEWRTLDLAALGIFVLASVLLFRFKVGIPTVIGVSAAAGLLVKAAIAVL